jgi:FMN-dependent NADH-azoreductase
MLQQTLVAAMSQFSEQWKQLHQQAGFTTQGVNDETLQKFSQLVVEQCVKIALHSQTTYTAAERIKEHFKQ